jgi:hypothetical protein
MKWPFPLYRQRSVLSNETNRIRVKTLLRFFSISNIFTHHLTAQKAQSRRRIKMMRRRDGFCKESQKLVFFLSEDSFYKIKLFFVSVVS